MKKIKYLILIFTLTISGCFITEKDITKMLFPVTMLISNENDKYQVYLLALSNTHNSKIEVETSTDVSKYTITKYEADSIDSAISKSGIATNGTTSGIKIKTVIFHESLFSNSSLAYYTLASYIGNNPLFRTNTYVYYSKDDPKDLLNINSLEVSDNYYYYIIRPEKENLQDFILPTRLVDTAKSYVDNKRMFYLPSLSVKTDSVSKDDNGELKNLNTYYVNGAYFLTRDGNFKFIDLEYLDGFKWMNHKKYFDIEIGSDKAPLYLKIERAHWSTYISNNKANVDLSIKVKINYNHTDYSLEKIEQEIKEVIKRDIYYTYTSLYKDIDIYLFSDLSYRLNKKLDIDSSFNLTIDVTIKNTVYEY